jgi:DNA-binding ferritin-like protein (Dps family)
LPADHRAAWGQIKVRVSPHSGFTGRNLTPILDGVLGLFEETAADGQSVHEVLGDDVAAFCDDLVKDSRTHAYSYQEPISGKPGKAKDQA